jgi:hypothetical protein
LTVILSSIALWLFLSDYWPISFSQKYFLSSCCPRHFSLLEVTGSSLVGCHVAHKLNEILLQIPASVRVKRESALPKPKPKFQQSSTSSVSKPSVALIKSEAQPSSSAPKPQSMDDSYMAFLEDMKQLGALDE